MTVNLKQLTASIVLFITGIASTIWVGLNLNFIFPSRPTVPDFSFILLPYIPKAGILADLVSLASGAILLNIALTNFKSKAPIVLSSLGLMYFFRALLILATPIGPSSGLVSYQALFNQTLNLDGMFPSGHIAFVTLPFLLAPTKLIKHLTLLLIILEGLALLLGRGHYTIDLFGGIVLMYLCLNLSQKLFRYKIPS